MFADVSQVPDYGNILLIIMIALVAIGFLKGFFKGFWKSVVSFALWIALIVGIVMFAQPVGEQLATMQFLENIISGFGDSEISAFLQGIIGPTAYVVIAALGMLILGAVIIGLINMIVRSLFRKKSFLSRLLAAIFGAAINAVFATLIFLIASSPLLFNGADVAIQDNEYLMMYQDSVVTPVQEILYDNELPSSVDDLVLIVLKQEPTEENKNSLYNLVEVVKDSEAYLESLVTEGNLNEVKVKELYSDLVFFCKIANDMDEGVIKGSLKASLMTTLEEFVSSMEISEGVPYGSVTVDAAKYDEMQIYMSDLGFELAFANRINAIFTK